jgi:hypothetical protein
MVIVKNKIIKNKNIAARPDMSAWIGLGNVWRRAGPY